jgi:hypothetical protein
LLLKFALAFLTDRLNLFFCSIDRVEIQWLISSGPDLDDTPGYGHQWHGQYGADNAGQNRSSSQGHQHNQRVQAQRRGHDHRL